MMMRVLIVVMMKRLVIMMVIVYCHDDDNSDDNNHRLYMFCLMRRSSLTEINTLTRGWKAHSGYGDNFIYLNGYLYTPVMRTYIYTGYGDIYIHWLRGHLYTPVTGTYIYTVYGDKCRRNQVWYRQTNFVFIRIYFLFQMLYSDI